MARKLIYNGRAFTIKPTFVRPFHINVFDIQFRLRTLNTLQDKAQRALELISQHVVRDGQSLESPHSKWIYTCSFIRCVSCKWKKVTPAEYTNVVFLHDKCLRDALMYNIQTTRIALSGLSNGESVLEEWDVIWAGIDD